MAQVGYPDARVADVVRSAGVSRATFYQLFDNKEACLLAAHTELSERIGLEVEVAIARGKAREAAHSAIRALAEAAEREPHVIDFLTHGMMLGGARAREARDNLLRRFEMTVESAWAQAPPGSPALDMSARYLLEGALRLLNLHQRKDGVSPHTLLPDLLRWLDCYVVPEQPVRWRTLAPETILLGKRTERLGGMSQHPSLPKGRHRLPLEVAKRVQRERITYATTQAIRTIGYADLTVADIVATAGVSRDAFYALFHDKDEAFDGAARLVFERLVAAMAGAFYGELAAGPTNCGRQAGPSSSSSRQSPASPTSCSPPHTRRHRGSSGYSISCWRSPDLSRAATATGSDGSGTARRQRSNRMHRARGREPPDPQRSHRGTARPGAPDHLHGLRTVLGAAEARAFVRAKVSAEIASAPDVA